jgi:hypothetical protein
VSPSRRWWVVETIFMGFRCCCMGRSERPQVSHFGWWFATGGRNGFERLGPRIWKASWARAPDSPVPGERRKREQPGQRRTTRAESVGGEQLGECFPTAAQGYPLSAPRDGYRLNTPDMTCTANPPM